MPAALPITPDRLRPHLEQCGYARGLLIPDYRFGEANVPLAGFFGRPFDTRTACLAVVMARGDARAVLAASVPLGAPTALVCGERGLEWWRLSPSGPAEGRTVPADRLAAFFKEHRAELSPGAIYSAKMRRPASGGVQMWFVDVGLMPAVERQAGQTLHRLVENVVRGLADRLGSQLRGQHAIPDLYKTVFWLLAAKLLHDKGVESFHRLELTDVDEVFRRVGRHYADVDDLPPGGKAWRPAVDEAAEVIARWGHLGNVSSESLAYLYEKGLIDEASRKGRSIRRELGIHSTPSVLIDHMMSQLWPLVEHHPATDRHVLEPACGQAGFLVAAMRWLRDFSGLPVGPGRHRYLRSHLRGIEIDPFAAELAKLSLTLADVPFGNSWRIDRRNMFDPGILAQAASRCTLLLANPPYEAFTPAERDACKHAGAPVTAITKAVEMLRRTLPRLPVGGAFGVVVPQGFLHDRESHEVRQFLLRDCELIEIDVFADNLFEEADHEVAVLMGRRVTAASSSSMIRYRRVRERGMPAFRERLAFSSEAALPQVRFLQDPTYGLLQPDLPGVWQELADCQCLDRHFEVQKGFELAPDRTCSSDEVVSRSRRPGWAKCLLRADVDYDIWQLPRHCWLNPARNGLRRQGAAAVLGKAQVIVNYARVSRDPWRLKAVMDPEGLAISSRFLSFRPKAGAPALTTLWAILNSPVANAYAYCFAGKRETLVREWRVFPLPTVSMERERAIAAAADAYLELVRADAFMRDRDEDAIRAALLVLDAEVLRLYDLPPRLERQLLDLFAGIERKGVGCEFRGYYPPELDAYVPLHELISEEYARSTLGRLRQQHRPAESEEIVSALRTAAAEFSED